ncbi:biofilm formation regulator HmsP [Izhakiella australiensis]|uniref:Biofilm formation regulator HmsP n=1 Tax=Izhakiella australiensis TaxID=1926881 RepID=A0A1S8YIJ4_9GAMM|nr:biofilm formation regulator HmsP [Izhakiella australiensis]OON38533.1 biofilm formation regulator HmsP [Izhakiella australiensis]
MRVTRSLTIKQMATVSAVTLVIVSLFILLQLFHFVQQRRIDYAQQMENVAHTIRQPLSEAVLKADIPQVERILATLKPAGVIARADIVLPNDIPALHSEFAVEKPVPALIAQLFDLPVTISVPLYSPERALPGPLASLVLQADSARVYQFIRATVATMLIAYLLLALMLTVAISWCINRLIVRPLRRLALELDALTPQDLIAHQLPLPPNHRDDELGQLILNYNYNQQTLGNIYDEMSRLTTHYALTGLPNKALFLALVEQQLKSVKNTAPLAIIVLRMETLQETNGIVTEDQRNMLLMTQVDRIRACIDEHSVLAQISNSDFALLVKRASNLFRAMRLARNLMQKLTQPVTLEQLQLRPVTSMGISLREKETQHGEELLSRASSAMMSAHHRGKNQIMFFEPSMTERAQRRLTQEHDILQGLEEESFALFLQPQIDMNSGKMVGAEALLRMCQPDGSWSLPEDLIANAEQLGVINPLGRWVLEESCRLLADWQKCGIDLPLSVNLSAIQLRDAAMVSHLRDLLSQYHIKPGSLVLELTETAQVGEPDQALQLLQKLREAGIPVALDDFGMGYANLNWLQQFKDLPISKLKMDRSFVAGLPEDDAMVRIVAAIAEIITIDVVAEGVETETQRDWLLARGIHIGQGYLYSEPLPINSFTARFLPIPVSVTSH